MNKKKKVVKAILIAAGVLAIVMTWPAGLFVYIRDDIEDDEEKGRAELGAKALTFIWLYVVLVMITYWFVGPG